MGYRKHTMTVVVNPAGGQTGNGLMGPLTSISPGTTGIKMNLNLRKPVDTFTRVTKIGLEEKSVKNHLLNLSVKKVILFKLYLPVKLQTQLHMIYPCYTCLLIQLSSFQINASLLYHRIQYSTHMHMHIYNS